MRWRVVRRPTYAPVHTIDYEKGIVWIKGPGTHKDYDQMDAAEVEHGD
jgi:mRNA-degrading endonuclease HigB of HigAB toxin-antitoxin module